MGSTRLTPFMVLLAALALVVAGVATAIYLDREQRKLRLVELEAQAQILASTVTAALAFADSGTAQEYVDALALNTSVVAAGVYDADGVLIASLVRGDATLPADARQAVDDDEGESIAEAVTVTQEETPLGTAYVRMAADTTRERIARFGPVGLLVTMGALLGVVLSAANARLRAQADDLAAANRELQSQIEQRELAEEALRQAQKMESIGQLTGGIAHDFNNILQAIMGALEMIRRRLNPDQDELARRLDMATDYVGRAASLTQRLLAFSRRQPLQPRRTDLNRLVAGMSELMRRSLGPDIAVETVLAGGLWPAMVDPNQLESAILNLAVNARDAMPQGGKLTIETANSFLDEAYAANQGGIASGQYVMLAVSDTGTGMTPDVLAKAMDPFFTTKDVGAGTGLGLSQVYGFVKQSDGHLRIYSEIGEGTVVKLYLPRLQGEAREEPLAPHPATAPGPFETTVLVVEDEEGVRSFAVDTLREFGCRVIEAPEAATALRLLDAHPEVGLLFTDVGLPGGMNGRQLADEALRRRPALKVLFTTGYARNAIVHQGRLDPGVHLITKPFTAADLAARLRQVLDG